MWIFHFRIQNRKICVRPWQDRSVKNWEASSRFQDTNSKTAINWTCTSVAVLHLAQYQDCCKSSPHSLAGNFRTFAVLHTHRIENMKIGTLLEVLRSLNYHRINPSEVKNGSVQKFTLNFSFDSPLVLPKFEVRRFTISAQWLPSPIYNCDIANLLMFIRRIKYIILYVLLLVFKIIPNELIN